MVRILDMTTSEGFEIALSDNRVYTARPVFNARNQTWSFPDIPDDVAALLAQVRPAGNYDQVITGQTPILADIGTGGNGGSVSVANSALVSSANGDDATGEVGDWGSPFATLGAAVSAGARVILVDDGTYTVNDITVGDGTTIRSVSGMYNNVTFSVAGASTFGLDVGSNIRIQGIKFVGTPQAMSAIRTNDSNIKIDCCRVELQEGATGIELQDGASFIHVLNSAIDCTASGAGTARGIAADETIGNSVTDVLVQGCTFASSGKDFAAVAALADRLIVEASKFEISGSSSLGFKHAERGVVEVIISKNIFTLSGNARATNITFGGGTEVIRNISFIENAIDAGGSSVSVFKLNTGTIGNTGENFVCSNNSVRDATVSGSAAVLDLNVNGDVNNMIILGNAFEDVVSAIRTVNTGGMIRGLICNSNSCRTRSDATLPKFLELGNCENVVIKGNTWRHINASATASMGIVGSFFGDLTNILIADNVGACAKIGDNGGHVFFFNADPITKVEISNNIFEGPNEGSSVRLLHLEPSGSPITGIVVKGNHLTGGGKTIDILGDEYIDVSDNDIRDFGSRGIEIAITADTMTHVHGNNFASSTASVRAIQFLPSFDASKGKIDNNFAWLTGSGADGISASIIGTGVGDYQSNDNFMIVPDTAYTYSGNVNQDNDN